MFIHYQSVQLQEERRQDLRREFEKRELVRQVLAGRDKDNHFSGRALIWLGRQLVTWGQWLQTHYTPTADGYQMPVAKKL